MNRVYLIAAASFLVIFAAIAFGRSERAEPGRADASTSTDSGRIAAGSMGEGPAGPDETTADRDGIRRFWELHRAATTLRVAGDFEGAVEAYRAALELDPSHEDALYFLGNAYIETGRFAAADSTLSRLVAAHPDQARGHIRRGELYLCYPEAELFDVRAAGGAFARGLELNREETGPMLRLAQAALVEGNAREAVPWLEAVIGTHATSFEAHLLLGYVAWKKGNRHSAHERYERALEILGSTYADPVIGEGDRKHGSFILPGEQATCPGMLSLLDPLLAPTDPQSADAAYRHIDASIARLASDQ